MERAACELRLLMVDPTMLRVRAGDWMCGCGANNFSFRTECFRCDAPRLPGISTRS